MLTRSQSKLIADRGLSAFHDYWTMSLTWGEPFFEEQVLTYHDGRFVTVCAVPLRGAPPAERVTIAGLVERWVVERGVEGVTYFGPEPFNPRRLRRWGFHCIGRAGPTAEAAEMFIDCGDGPTSSRRRRLHKRARAGGFEANVRAGGLLTAEHLRVVESFYAQKHLTSYLAQVAFSLPAVLRSRRVHIIEARKDGRLRGFVALHRPFTDVAVALFLAHDCRTPGVCDFLYSEMIEHARRLGAARLNVGQSPSRGHISFKRKWGGEPETPLYYSEWARGRLARRHHTSWGLRVIRL